jgi:hypothetical protein
MRLVFGMFLGVLLTLGVAYIHDTQVGPPAPSALEQKTMMNWHVVGENWRALSGRISEQFAKLTNSEPAR